MTNRIVSFSIIIGIALLLSGCVSYSETRSDGSKVAYTHFGGGNRLLTLPGGISASHQELPAYLRATGALVGEAAGAAIKP